MALGYESEVINGQLVNVAPAQSFSPLTFGSTYTGPGFWPRNGQWNLPPLLPNATAQAGNLEYSPGNLGGPMTTQAAMNASGGINYFHPTKSPILWVLGTLALALFLLHKVHYGK